MTNVKLPEEFYITKENLSELLPKFSKCVESTIKHSWYVQKYLEYIGAKHLIVFPIPLSAIIRKTTVESITMNKATSNHDVSTSIIERLVSEEISYLSFKDTKDYTKVLEAINQSILNFNIFGIDHTGFYNNEVFPLVDEHLSMQQLEREELKTLIHTIPGMGHEKNEVFDECRAYVLFWMKYCEYKDTKIY